MMRLNTSKGRRRPALLMILIMLVMLFSLLGIANMAMAGAPVPVTYIAIQQTVSGVTVPETCLDIAPLHNPEGETSTGTLTAAIFPSNATNNNVTWTLNNIDGTNAASITPNGLTCVVTGVNPGIATVTVTAGDTTYGALSATCTVIVNYGNSAGIAAPEFTVRTGYTGGQYTINKTYGFTATPAGDENLSSLASTDQMYSYIDSMPRPDLEATQGVSLATILNDAAGISTSSISTIGTYAEDTGPYSTHPASYYYGSTRYYYPNQWPNWDYATQEVDPQNLTAAEAGAVAVDTVIDLQEDFVKLGSESTPPPTFSEMGNWSCPRTSFGEPSTAMQDDTVTASQSVKWVYQIDVTLTGTPVTGVTLSNDTGETIAVGGNPYSLTATVSGLNGGTATNQAVIWASSNPSVATVDQNGNVTAVTAGNATISATTADGRFFDICPVTVTEPPAPALTATPTAAAGSTYGTTTITASPNTSGDTLAYLVSTTSISTPNVGDPLPSGTVTSGTSITAAANDYVGVYEVNGSGIIVSFSQIQLTSSQINNTAPSLTTTPTAAAGSSNGTTAITASPNTSGDTLAYLVSTTSITTPNVGTSVPSGAVSSGSNITAAAGDYVGVYESNGSGIVAFSQIQLSSSQINVVPTGITLSQSSATINAGATLQLTAQLAPSGATSAVTWTSDNGVTVNGNPGVASVSSTGLVTPIADGNAVITATTANGLTATCHVTVTGESTAGATTFMTIYVNGGPGIDVTDAQINALNPNAGTIQGCVDYSSTKNGGMKAYYTVMGAPWTQILTTYCGIPASEVQNVTTNFLGSGAYSTLFPPAYISQTRYYYPSGSTTPAGVVPMEIGTADDHAITTSYSNVTTLGDSLRNFYGQISSTEVTTNNFNQNVQYADVTYNPAPSLTANATVGTKAGDTAATATLNSSSDHLAYLLSTTSQPTPNVGDAITSTHSPIVGVVNNYASGANIAGATAGEYLGIYELNSSNLVTAFTQVQLSSSQIATYYTVSVTASPTADGNVTGGGSYASGASVTLTATPASGYSFTNWTDASGNVVSTSASYTFTASANVSYTANFTAEPAPALTTTPTAAVGSSNGTTTVTASPNTSSDTLAYLVSTSSISTPNVGDSLPSGAVTSGTNITAVAGDYIGVYEVNSSGVDAFSQVGPLTASQIYTAVTGVTVTPGSANVTSVTTLTASVSPANASNQTVTWTSDNTTVATVNSTTGAVTPKGVGTAVITATTADGGFTATCDVTVPSGYPDGATTFMTIYVNGGPGIVVTDAEINALNANYGTVAGLTDYSGTNAGGGTKYYTVEGATWNQILTAYAGLTANQAAASSVEFVGDDNYPATLPGWLLSEPRYYYATPTSTGVPVQMEIGTADDHAITTTMSAVTGLGDCLRNFYGQANPTEKILNNYDQNVWIAYVTYNPAPSVTATAAPGSTNGSTAVTATLNSSADHIGYLLSNSSQITPNVGDAVPTGVTLESGNSAAISGVTAGEYVTVYELNVSNQVQAFTQIQLTASQIKTVTPAPSLTTTPTAAAGSTTGTTAITASPNTSGDTLAVLVSTGSISFPNVGDAVPSVATNPYISGSNLSAAAGDYVGVYEAGSSGVVAFSQIGPLTDSQIYAAVTGVTLDHVSYTLTTVGSTVQLTPTINPSNATNTTLNWTSDNTAVATVSNSGLVTDVEDGSAILTATTTDGSNISATCNVLVNNGNGVAGPTTFMIIKVNGGTPVTVTDSQILALNPTDTMVDYSSNGSRYYTCLGAPFASILSTYAGLTPGEAQSVSATFIGSDNYMVTIPEAELFQTRYYYPSNGGSPVPVVPIIATADDHAITTDPTQLSGSDCLRNFFGQYNSDHTSNLLDQNIKEIDVTCSPAPSLTATAVPGSVNGATAITATPNKPSSDHLAVLVSTTSILTPNVGDPAPTSGTPGFTNGYVSGSDITGVAAGEYVGVYELNVSNQVQDFSQITMTASEINNITPAPSLTATPTAASGSSTGTTAIAVSPNTSGDTLAVLVSTGSIATPNVGDALPAGAINGYTSGSDITGVAVNDYVGVYEVNSSSSVVAFSQIALSAGDINSTPTLSGIAITTPATKLTYTVGDTLDLTGLVVTGTYSDKSTQVEPITAADVTGFNSSAVNPAETLTITYDGQTATYTVAITGSGGNPGGGTGGTESFPILKATPSYFEQW